MLLSTVSVTRQHSITPKDPLTYPYAPLTARSLRAECISDAGGLALQWLLQQRALAAVPLHSLEPGEQAERYTHLELPVESTPRSQPQVCRGAPQLPLSL